MGNGYFWQKPYYDAVLETDNEKLGHLINQTERAIDLRLDDISNVPLEERDEIARTLTALSTLKTERIGRTLEHEKSS